MNDQREWETLLHPGRTLGPLAPSLVPSTWALLLREQVERARLQAYAILADGGRSTCLVFILVISRRG